ncbi:hypothetical protein HBH56_047040 [Parastagonospora nodorum]|uniref:Uncharacterized protein n=1 Tax=Phaeosphaeria nodorum (strain SN15 / ATCC MYA-4574 / FGSC 10173) TaxID=321614 RepID=A0A7U2HUP9_PHANO|nr:hypothetical protein HBH56_047040 [Parastagonospora nodorum]QRC92565.1 hypothetical protein JI435_402700 [Parastagonospora nodorum SN15]KAH3933393.1 hypothetical protein HBH54_074780 [Parastagonospora nodorum]KAH3946331.1 hypothetical protein HBH53_133920 [Parastagonospora nodorum]KAH4139432.1 hypothetical protein HBH45_088930 [Parastagonospora nodorum]
MIMTTRLFGPKVVRHHEPHATTHLNSSSLRRTACFSTARNKLAHSPLLLVSSLLCCYCWIPNSYFAQYPNALSDSVKWFALLITYLGLPSAFFHGEKDRGILHQSAWATLRPRSLLGIGLRSCQFTNAQAVLRPTSINFFLLCKRGAQAVSDSSLVYF